MPGSLKSHEVVIEGTATTARVRKPWLVAVLAFLTGSIYAYFWWYFINRELVDFGRGRGAEGFGATPALSVLALSIGGYILVPPVWTIVATSRRVQHAEREVGLKPLNGWLAAALWVFTATIGGVIYTQVHLNRVWNRPENEPVRESDPDQLRRRALELLHERGALNKRELTAERKRLEADAAERKRLGAEA